MTNDFYDEVPEAWLNKPKEVTLILVKDFAIASKSCQMCLFRGDCGFGDEFNCELPASSQSYHWEVKKDE